MEVVFHSAVRWNFAVRYLENFLAFQKDDFDWRIIFSARQVRNTKFCEVRLNSGVIFQSHQLKSQFKNEKFAEIHKKKIIFVAKSILIHQKEENFADEIEKSFY